MSQLSQFFYGGCFPNDDDDAGGDFSVVQDLECSDLWWHAASFVILCLPASTSMSMTMMTIFDLGLEHLATVFWENNCVNSEDDIEVNEDDD